MFIDSSVFFAAAYSVNGSARDLLLQAIIGRVTLVLSDFVLEESGRNLAMNAPAGLPAFRRLRVSISYDLAKPTSDLTAQAGSVVASKDAPIVAGAKVGGATMLATYDRKHLLSHRDAIERVFNIRVATPDEVLRILSAQEEKDAA